MVEHTQEKLTENGVSIEMLMKVRAYICLMAQIGDGKGNGIIARDMNDIIDTKYLERIANGKFDRKVQESQMDWLMENYRSVVKLVNQYIKENPGNDTKAAGEKMLVILKAARINIRLRKMRNANKCKILKGIKGAIDIMTPTPREKGDPVLRGMIDRYRKGEAINEVTINSEEAFRWCLGVINEVKEGYSEMLYDEGGNEIGEGVPKERVPECEREALDQLVPYIANAIDLSEANARDFRIFLEERFFEDGKEGGVQAEIKFIMKAWTSACVDNFPKKCGEIVTKLNQEACEIRTRKNSRIEETRYTIKEMILSVLTLRFLRHPSL
jgi:hypothetical protein